MGGSPDGIRGGEDLALGERARERQNRRDQTGVVDLAGLERLRRRAIRTIADGAEPERPADRVDRADHPDRHELRIGVRARHQLRERRAALEHATARDEPAIDGEALLEQPRANVGIPLLPRPDIGLDHAHTASIAASSLAASDEAIGAAKQPRPVSTYRIGASRRRRLSWPFVTGTPS